MLKIYFFISNYISIISKYLKPIRTQAIISLFISIISGIIYHSDKNTKTISSSEVIVISFTFTLIFLIFLKLARIIYKLRGNKMDNKPSSNTPISIDNQALFLLFILLMIVSSFFLFGLIPFLMFTLGFYLMKKNKNFSYLKTAAKYSEVYFLIGLFVSLLLSIYLISTYFDEAYWSSSYSYDSKYWRNKDPAFISIISSIVFLFYFVIIRAFMYNTLCNHKDWVLNNSIFSTTPKTNNL